MKPYVMGLVWDHWTPQVQAQVVKDLIAIQNEPGGQDLAVYYDSEDPQIASLLNTLRVKRVPLAALATLWVLYRTGVDPLEAPEHAVEVVERDMRISVAKPDMLDTGTHTGPALAPQDRTIAPTLTLNKPAPAWYPGGPGPMITWLWS